MKVSVLITTYNRAELLRRALGSVLAQDYRDMQVTVIDDCSTDHTAEVVESFADERVRYVRNPVNVGSVGGDLAIIRRFLSEFCDGDAFVYLCDDDYWLPSDLISRQVAAMKAHPSLAFVQGGMVHCYPHGVPDAPANESYLRYSFLDAERTQIFWGGLYPGHFMRSRKYLRLFAEDPKNRNIVIGATLFRTAPFQAAGIMGRCRGVRWQAGYAILAGAAVQGDVYYIDEPCLGVTVRGTTASHSGTQLDNFRECLNSIDAAFTAAPEDEELRDIRALMMLSAFRSFLCNKIANRAGWFNTHPLGDMSSIMIPEIRGIEFTSEMEARGVALTADQRQLIEWSDILKVQSMKEVTWWRGVLAMAA